jgi:hypothetical protein
MSERASLERTYARLQRESEALTATAALLKRSRSKVYHACTDVISHCI